MALEPKPQLGMVEYRYTTQRVPDANGKRQFAERITFVIKSSNGESLVDSKQGSRDLSDARRGFAAVCTALGADPKQVKERLPVRKPSKDPDVPAGR